MDAIAMLLCILPAIACCVASYFQFREKGVLLNNAYFYASREERQHMNKKPYYRQSGVVFCLLGIIFLLNAVQILTDWEWIFVLVIALVIATVIYAVASSVLIEKRRG